MIVSPAGMFETYKPVHLYLTRMNTGPRHKYTTVGPLRHFSKGADVLDVVLS